MADTPRTGTGWTVDDSTFGARLALIRQHEKWNIKEAAMICGLPPASWANWERGDMFPRRMVETCKLIATRSGCDFYWLLTGDASPARVTEGYAVVPAQRQAKTRRIPKRSPVAPTHRPPSRGDTRRPRLARFAESV